MLTLFAVDASIATSTGSDETTNGTFGHRTRKTLLCVISARKMRPLCWKQAWSTSALSLVWNSFRALSALEQHPMLQLQSSRGTSRLALCGLALCVAEGMDYLLVRERVVGTLALV